MSISDTIKVPLRYLPKSITSRDRKNYLECLLNLESYIKG